MGRGWAVELETKMDAMWKTAVLLLWDLVGGKSPECWGESTRHIAIAANVEPQPLSK